ncbi:MAG: hypothetical protein ACLGHT_10420 [Acidimicrobiia bacterium]
MTVEEDAARLKVEVLARQLDAEVITGISSTFSGDTRAAIEAWDRALAVGLALEGLRLEPVQVILQTTAARLAAWEDSEEEIPGQARLLRRHRAPGRAKRPKTALHTVLVTTGRACAMAISVAGLDDEEHRRLLVRALGAVLAPGSAPPANASALKALASRQVVDWETASLLEAALGG